MLRERVFKGCCITSWIQQRVAGWPTLPLSCVQLRNHCVYIYFVFIKISEHHAHFKKNRWLLSPLPCMIGILTIIQYYILEMNTNDFLFPNISLRLKRSSSSEVSLSFKNRAKFSLGKKCLRLILCTRNIWHGARTGQIKHIPVLSVPGIFSKKLKQQVI